MDPGIDQKNVWEVGPDGAGLTSEFFLLTMCQFKSSESGSSKYFIEVFFSSRRLNNRQ
jgi:hypothetical protein